MRAKRARELGLAPALPDCKKCGKQLKRGAGSGKAFSLGLCWDCWKITEEGKVDRRRLNLRSTNWACGYVIKCADGRGKFETSARAAISFAAKLRKDCIIAVVWKDGTVTVHPGLTSKNCSGLTPEDGDEILEGYQWFHSFVPEAKRTWFEA